MYEWRNKRRTRAAFFLFALVVLVFQLVHDSAEARPRRRAPSGDEWKSGHASIVVDAKTGKVLHESRADAPRHPASLTKIMTLYLLFEQIEAGKLTPSSKLSVSARAAAQAPSKLGLDEEDDISVDAAIKALVTRSANDVAVAVAEAIGGSEEKFAELMTRKARALGMTHTIFRNASGLPDPQQITTARDLALLGRAIQDRFPDQYRYFATRSFRWNGAGIQNHNRLLGRVQGVDGIKTGYTLASGFNLVTNVRANGRHIVAVVLGGSTAARRDAHMRELIRGNLPRAFAGTRTAPLIAEATPPTSRPPVRLASAGPVPLPAPSPTRTQAGSADPIRPTPVKTYSVGRNGEVVSPPPAAPGTLGTLPASSLMTSTQNQAQPLQLVPETQRPDPIGHAIARVTPAPVNLTPSPAPASATVPAVEIPAPAATPAPAGSPIVVASTAPIPTPIASGTPVLARSGWQIQIGAFPDERQARERIEQARVRLGAVLDKASAYTEKTVKGSTTYFRARFAGLAEEAARRACSLLKRNEIDCLAFKN